MTTITGKSQLTERISKKIKLTKNQIDSVITNFLEETKKSLLKGEEVRLQGYFTLKTAITKPRMAMNLQTKKKMKVPAKRVPKCKFSVSLKEEISQVYLILELENGESILVFGGKVNQESKGVEIPPINQRLIYFTYLETLKDGYLLFAEEWQA
ncbi:19219_t:CDS:2 [Racocetra fulgida]|uniref:19219_t:CDS:1 n=1 Tax=Racocetra fulgida TaxID=60492 RepID=A0A9N8VHC0_9GLOM|nr:19219_t:CDS:2 [Racocetra fulgida]